jgi:uncharacterized protein
MKQTIFSPEPHRGWLPWTWLAPFICILLVAFVPFPLDYGLEWIGLTNAEGEPVSTFGFCMFLLLPFSAMGAGTWAWARFVERRSPATLGLTGSRQMAKLVAGIAAGVCMVALTVISIWLAGRYVSGDILPAFFSPVSLFWIAILLACFVVQSGVEEFIFRGWLLSTVTRRWNLTAGFIVSSLAFTLVHLSPNQPAREIISSFTFALFACARAWRAGSIWGVMGWHAGWNWFTGVGFAVPITGLDVRLPALLVQLTPTGPDFLTGGPAGPEGSVLTIGLLAAATLLVLLWPRGSLVSRPLTSSRSSEPTGHDSQ